MNAKRRPKSRPVFCAMVWLALVAGMQPLSAVHAGEGLVAHYTFDEGPGGMVSVYIARLDPTHSNEYCLWPATIMRAITAA